VDQQEYEFELNLRRYDNAVRRQQYFSEFCRNTFNFYVKVGGWICAAVAALVSYSSDPISNGNGQVTKDDFVFLLEGSLYIVILLGALSIFQIVFCLFRWYGYRTKKKN